MKLKILVSVALLFCVFAIALFLLVIYMPEYKDIFFMAALMSAVTGFANAVLAFLEPL